MWIDQQQSLFSDALIELWTDVVVETSGLWTYAGETQISLLPEHDEKVCRVYAGEIPLGLAPEHGERIGRAYAGEVQITLTPEHTEKVGRACSGEIPLTLTPEHAEKVIRSYLGEIPLSALPEGAYLFEATTGTVWQYSGEIPVSLLPEGWINRTATYSGDIAFSQTLESLFSFSLMINSMLEIALIPEAENAFRQMAIYRNPYGRLILCSFAGPLYTQKYHGNLVDLSK